MKQIEGVCYFGVGFLVRKPEERLFRLYARYELLVLEYMRRV